MGEILIVAGEASADRYGAALVRRLAEEHGGGVRFWGTGGDAMRDAGVELLGHVRDMGLIGVGEVLSGVRAYHRLLRRLAEEAAARPPAVAVLLDFPDFNLRLAKKLKRLGVKIVYYISPQVWAWRGGRVRVIRKCVDEMLVILPFEEDFYRRRGVRAEFVGHPLLEDFRPAACRAEFDGFLAAEGLEPGRQTVALLPGSRKKEIGYILPALLDAAKLLAGERPVQFLVSAAPTVGREHVESVVRARLGGFDGKGRFRVTGRSSRDLLANADFAMVKSGTSVLEAALCGVPFLVTYKISALSWGIGSLLIRTHSKGLVNLLAGRRLVPELFQGEATPEALARTAREYLDSPEKCAALRGELGKIRTRLGARRASETAAGIIGGYLREAGLCR
ncbi:MAG: lipid-A-disaccharide synthase [Acidobacteriota bacterium]|jgi:lipid-A-disaccharide synthase|nr:lipid-A-disaccharide synthase [Acidobacteriota bacterium]